MYKEFLIMAVFMFLYWYILSLQLITYFR